MQLDRSPRFKLAAPVVFSWKTNLRSCAVVRGTTRDVSVDGLFVHTAECPPVKAVVRCQVLFPSLRNGTSSERMMMTVIGRVQRIEAGTNDGGPGFALQTRKLTLTSEGPEEEWWAEGMAKRLENGRRGRSAAKNK